MKARRRRRHRDQREAFDFSQDPTHEVLAGPHKLPSPLAVIDDQVSRLFEVEDYRRWDPDRRSRSALLTSGLPATRRKIPATKQFSPLVGFNDPRHAVVCVRRKQRREVLFAKFKTGKGSRRRQRRRNEWSDYKC